MVNERAKRAALALGMVLALLSTGCVTLDSRSLRKFASVVGYATPDLVSVRKAPRSLLASQLQLLSRSGPKPTPRTEQVLRQYDLVKIMQADPQQGLAALEQSLVAEPAADKAYAFAELAYIQAKQAEAKYDQSLALDMYGASVAHSYAYLFSPQFDGSRNPYDPQFRQACNLYNEALEGAMRIVHKIGKLQPGNTHSIKTCGQQIDIAIVASGRWHADDFERFEFVSDYELKGLNNQHQTYGLGVPLIAVRKQHEGESPDEKYYPPGLSFPITAFLRVLPSGRVATDGNPASSHCVLELRDPLESTDVIVGGRRVPLESDISTPLAYYLNDPLVKTNALATFALLDADFAKEFKGLYMLEPFDPNKIPVVMVHGLWSSPVTWMEMFNDLRSMPEIREHYQFWFYLYPTGQPFWISAAQMRSDVTEVRRTLDPRLTIPKLDQMVLVGHSMGGLVSKMQTLESGQEYWHILTDKPFDQLQADEETRQRLAGALFFQPNPSVRRVVTIGTPHRGSHFANGTTRWLGRGLIKLPSMLTSVTQRVVRDNPGFFHNTELLTIDTSIDSLAPDSPVFPVMLRSPKAPWVRYHNIVGRAPKKGLLGSIAGEGDGVVPLDSARLGDTNSQIEVEADHVTVHQHPRSVLEVRRILREHLAEMYAQSGGNAGAAPVAYQHTVSPADQQTESPPVSLPPVQSAHLPHSHQTQPRSYHRTLQD
jgi:pimeloyl-ACP methyl ester carboxylesterase